MALEQHCDEELVSTPKRDLDLDANGEAPISPQTLQRELAFCTMDLTRMWRRSTIGGISPIDTGQGVVACPAFTPVTF